MFTKLALPGVLAFVFLVAAPAIAQWNPPAKVSLDEIVATSKAVLAMPDIKLRTKEEIIRIHALEMDWDIGAMTYKPEDPSKVLKGPDGRKAGAFLLHGGSGDYRAMDPIARHGQDVVRRYYGQLLQAGRRVLTTGREQECCRSEE